jgi:uncharacterized phage-like protein YoqJ
MVIGITGHRPDKLGGYDDAKNRYFVIKEALFNLFVEYKPDLVVVGMALGVDQWAAEAAIMLEKPVMALIPCAGQERIWPTSSQVRYRTLLKEILSKGGKVIQLSNEPYRPDLMLKRNGEIVKLSDLIIAVWNGSAGGTANCVTQAKHMKKHVVILHPHTLKVTHG